MALFWGPLILGFQGASMRFVVMPCGVTGLHYSAVLLGASHLKFPGASMRFVLMPCGIATCIILQCRVQCRAFLFEAAGVSTCMSIPVSSCAPSHISPHVATNRRHALPQHMGLSPRGLIGYFL